MIVMKFDTEIKGDCVVEGHKDWITLDSFQWGVGRGISSSGVGKDRDTSNPSFSEVTVTKSMDIASTELWRQAVCGKSLGKCTIHFIQTGGTDAKGQVYYEVILHEPIISAYSASSGGDRPSESLSINFVKVEHKYDVFSEGKQVTKGESKKWDLMANAIF